MIATKTALATYLHLGQLPRWLGLFSFSMLLHSVALLWLDGRLESHGVGREQGHAVMMSKMEARLLPAPEQPKAPQVLASNEPPPRDVASQPTPRAKPVKPAKPQHFAAEKLAEPEPVPEPATEVPSSSVAQEASPTPAPPPNAETPATASGSNPGLAPVKEEEKLPVYAVSPPPPARLNFSVQTSYNGNPVTGSAFFDWQHNGQGYQLHSETKASLLFFTQTFATLESIGRFDAAGLAPALYQEKLKRGTTNTHFNHFRADAPEHPTNGNTISFSASTATYARPAGAQDRLSILWQLAGIGRATPEAFKTGAEFTILVAATRNADVWRIQVLGQEEMRIHGKTYQTWHVQRLPRPGSYDRKLEIWFAPQEEWFPVRVLQTEVGGKDDGKTYDFTLEEIVRKPFVPAPTPTVLPEPVPVSIDPSAPKP